MNEAATTAPAAGLPPGAGRVGRGRSSRYWRPTTDDLSLALLTERETEVLVQIARGLSNQEIAAELYVGEATVKTHVGRVLSKLNLSSRAQAVACAYETALIVPGQD